MSVPQHMIVDDAVFKAVRQILVQRTGRGLTEADVRLINAALALDDPKPAPALNYTLTENVLLELFSHEAIIREMYKDSVGVETWSAGLTAKSGINVRLYKDNPASMQVCINAVVDRLHALYIPRVVQAFNGMNLSEAQFAAALSFEYNTGAITRADWVKDFLQGNRAAAYKSIMNWRSPPEIISRREKERELFFNGVWTNDGKTNVYQVNKPSYTPRWSSLQRVDVRAEIKKALNL